MRGLPGDSESGENPIMPNNLMKARGNRPQQFLKKLVGPRLISVVRREQKVETVPAERAARRFAPRRAFGLRST